MTAFAEVGAPHILSSIQLVKQTTVTPSADATDRLASIEQRLLALAAILEPLPAMRLSEPASGALDAVMATLQSLTAEMRAREGVAEWDAADQLIARLMLRTLAAATLELRRMLADGSTALEEGADRLREAARFVEALERQLTPDSAPEG
jgi:hypothetical protein